MLFLMGPRQVGKTTIAQDLESDWPRHHYYTWDNSNHRKLIRRGEQELGEELLLGSRDEPIPLVVFDELHKFRSWKRFLKGFYDTFPSLAHILVTGSARLDVYQKGADSLMGRYFRYRIHPLSVRELIEPEVTPVGLRPEPCPIDDDLFDALWRFGGFPDPLSKASERHWTKWHTLRNEQLFREDLSDLSHVREIAQLEMLAEFIRRSAGSQVSYSSLGRKVGAAHTSIRRWINWLTSLYYCFEIRPWSKNLSRSLLKEPKYYMTDWSAVDDPGARAENLVACHLLKAANFWTDYGTGVFKLYYLRDRDGREVDFLLTRDDKPWLLVEVKLNHAYTVSPHLNYFQKQIQAPYALQVVFDLPDTQRPCFIDNTPRIVPARTFLSQLV